MLKHGQQKTGQAHNSKKMTSKHSLFKIYSVDENIFKYALASSSQFQQACTFQNKQTH